jgi:hypothetical protein
VPEGLAGILKPGVQSPGGGGSRTLALAPGLSRFSLPAS